jgi:hypothetical protein
MAPLAGQLPRVPIERLAMAAAGTDGVCKGEIPTESLELSRLASHQAPPLGWMVTDLEEPPVHRYVAAVHIQHDDLAGRNAHDRVPGPSAEEMRAAFPDTRPAPGLESCGTNGTSWNRHAT